MAMIGISRRFLLLLAASVALNLFFVGIWAGRHWSGRDRGPDAEGLGVHAFLRRSGLGDAGPAVQQIVHEQRAAVRQHMHELADARAQVRAALQAEPFDAARLDAALAVLEARTGGMQRDMHSALSKVARVLDPAQRARMADALWPRPGFGQRGPRF
jgi:uncharacterized membrane protein